jgi:hypothetical protein
MEGLLYEFSEFAAHSFYHCSVLLRRYCGILRAERGIRLSARENFCPPQIKLFAREHGFIPFIVCLYTAQPD